MTSLVTGSLHRHPKSGRFGQLAKIQPSVKVASTWSARRAQRAALASVPVRASEYIRRTIGSLPETAMDRFTISVDDDFAVAFDELIKQHDCTTPRAAVQDFLREHLQKLDEQGKADGCCIANLSYVYFHHELELAKQLASI